MKTTLNDLIESTALEAIKKQKPDGLMPSGSNGPYGDAETPVRNTAHWLITFCHVYKKTQDQRFFNAAQKATDYLLNAKARPMGATFFCRQNPEKDLCNGLMGQAWVLEGLLAASKTLKREEAFHVAREVFHLHPFLENHAVWRRVAVDGSYLTPDGTFNHQLWFAAIGAELEDKEATEKAYKFLDQVAVNVQTYQNGVIFHLSRLGKTQLKDLTSPIYAAKTIKYALTRQHKSHKLYSKSVGYHGFNLYAFSILKKHFPQHSFWSSKTLKKMLSITKQPVFRKELNTSDYSWSYNPPGFEFAFCGEIFDLGQDYCQEWINEQAKNTYEDRTNNLMTKNVPDPVTSSARIYEATRLNHNYEILIDDNKR